MRKLTGVAKLARQLNLDAFIDQARDYDGGVEVIWAEAFRQMQTARSPASYQCFSEGRSVEHKVLTMSLLLRNQ
jgi:hypothetical protein